LRDNDYERAGRGRRRRFDDDEPQFLKHLPKFTPETGDDDMPDTGDRWSTWDLSTAGERGPKPHPDWVVTELAAVDTELGIVKTGKDASVA
jgi:RIO kinase 1